MVSPKRPESVDCGLRTKAAEWTLPSHRPASFSDQGIPRFLNVSGSIEKARDWDAAEIPRLWRYNLHYFDDLNAEGAARRTRLHRKLIDRWVIENPVAAGTGWEPYPCSLRIVNWIKWALAGNELLPEWVESLALQAAWLDKNIEWHLLGNHLFANAKALVFAGLFFEDREAQRWLKKGLNILGREIPEQVLSDGGQFERSPMYHAIALEDVLDLVNIAETYSGLVAERTIADWRAAASSMLAWARVMRHPDGDIVLFNDSAFSITPSPDELEQYANRLGVSAASAEGGLTFLDPTGYVRAERDDAVLFCDVGLIGPDYLPGHAHADTLGFELSLFGERWFVDSGCSTYEVCDERLRQRGTAAHNTVTIDGEDSSEVWSSFRAARRARPINVAVHSKGEEFVVSAGHDGYRRLKGKVTHHREFRLRKGALSITDYLSGKPKSAEANFLLHPDVTIQQEDNVISLTRAGKSASLSFSGGDYSISQSTWHPEFGLSIPTHRISVTMAGDTLVSKLRW